MGTLSIFGFTLNYSFLMTRGLPFPSRTATRFLHHNIVSLGLPLGVRVVFVAFIIISQVLGQFPELFGPQLVIRTVFGLVPKDLVGYFVGLGVVVQNQRTIILSSLIHHRAKRLQCGEHRGEVLPNLLTIGQIVLTQYCSRQNFS